MLNARDFVVLEIIDLIGYNHGTGQIRRNIDEKIRRMKS